ncbi:hypothetical protein FS837_011470 [Tulasnella sp. UAMH 9824]|nr:hypothetical protein FS837_011470 [Tulasnella sp. UAMH 9824]
MNFKPKPSLDSSTCVSLDPESEPQTTVSSGFEEKIALAPRRHWTTQPAKPRLLGLLPTAAVLLMIVGLLTLMFRALLGYQCQETQKGLGMMAALRIGFFATIEGDAKEYGLLVRLMGSSSVTSIGEAYVYIAQSWNRGKLPRLFRHSVWLASAVWILTRLLGLADVWLHSESYSFHNYLSVPDKGGPSMYGVAFNQSICPDLQPKYRNSTLLGTMEPSCQLVYEAFTAREHWGIDIGLDVMTDSSNRLYDVHRLASGTTIVAPSTWVAGYNNKTFKFPTFGAQAACTSINHLCEKDEEGATISCTGAGYPQLPYVDGDGGEFSRTGRIQNRIFGVIAGRLITRNYSLIDTTYLTYNPTTLAIQLQWQPPTQTALDESHVHSATSKVPASEMAIDHFPLPTLYATCNLTFFDTFVHWTDRGKVWSEVNKTVSPPELASALWLPVVWQRITEQVAADIMYTARRKTKEETMLELSYDLAKLSLGAAAGFYEPAEEFGIEDLSVVMVAIYPVVPVMVLLGLLFVYALLVLALFLSSCCLPDESIVIPVNDDHQDNEVETSMLTLAQRWLTNPLPLVGFAFPRGDGLDGTRSAAFFAINTAYGGDEAHTRLAIGLNGERFGVIPWGERRYYAQEA